MKKIIVLVFVSFCFLSFKSDSGKIKKGTFYEEELNFIKTNYNWSTEDFLIINFRQPKFKCHYDNYSNIDKSNTAILKLYSEIDLKNIRVLAISSEYKKTLNTIDNVNHFGDLDNFFTKKVFKKGYSCYGLVVIKKDGNYRYRLGEYVTKDIQNLLSELY